MPSNKVFISIVRESRLQSGHNTEPIFEDYEFPIHHVRIFTYHKKYPSRMRELVDKVKNLNEKDALEHMLTAVTICKQQFYNPVHKTHTQSHYLDWDGDNDVMAVSFISKRDAQGEAAIKYLKQWQC